MTKKLLDLSSKIDAGSVSLYRDMNEIAEDLPWFVIGATARDVCLHHQYGLPIQRATRDIDLGVQLASWREYETLKAKLLDSKNFTSSATPHRVIHSKSQLPLDLVPFGGLATKEEVIQWPHDSSTVMNTTGYKDAFLTAQLVRIASGPDLEIRIASSSSIAFLKILAWNENPLSRAKDADDLAFILTNYIELGNWDRLKGADEDLTESDPFNPVWAGARMLGRDIRASVNDKTRNSVLSVLERELSAASQSRLAIAMLRTLKSELREAISLIENLTLGLKD